MTGAERSGGDDAIEVGLDDIELLDEPAALAAGIDAFVAGDLARAEASFRDAAYSEPGSGEAHYFLGKATRDAAEARAALERAVALRPEWFAAWRALALRCAAQGDSPRAAEAAATARELAPDEGTRDALDRDLASAGAVALQPRAI